MWIQRNLKYKQILEAFVGPGQSSMMDLFYETTFNRL